MPRSHEGVSSKRRPGGWGWDSVRVGTVPPLCLRAGAFVPGEITHCQARTRAVPHPASQDEEGPLGPHGPSLARTLALPPPGRVLWADPAPPNPRLRQGPLS